MLPVLAVPEISATSPTLVEIMRACPLRAGLSKANGSSAFTLGSPKAWLGIAYHKVLEKIVACDFAQETLEAAVERLWNRAISTEAARAETHALNRRFGPPITWPGYYLAYASVLLRARELCVGPGGPVKREITAQQAPSGSLREHEFVGFGGRLIGKPDVIRDDEVVDYKSGSIFENDEASHGDVIKAIYVRQLRIYGYLAKQALGRWPSRGILLPLAGPGVDVELEPSECTRESEEAVTLLDSYNAKVRAGADATQLGSPSPSACEWCPYKLLCPVFWRTASAEWSGKLDGAAIEGALAQTPRLIHGGASAAISIEIQSGSEARRRAEISPLNLAVHSVATLSAGERIRIVGLRARPDGSLVPTQRTVLMRVVDIPRVAASGESGTAGS